MLRVSEAKAISPDTFRWSALDLFSKRFFVDETSDTLRLNVDSFTDELSRVLSDTGVSEIMQSGRLEVNIYINGSTSADVRTILESLMDGRNVK